MTSHTSDQLDLGLSTRDDTDQLARALYDLDTTREELTLSQQQVQRLEEQLTLYRSLLRSSNRPTHSLPAALDRELLRLLTVCHPDKWSNGQSALALAHELASGLNDLRQRIEEGRL